MHILLTNTLTREKEVFTPIHQGRAGIYHCGPTVYWTQHIGNMRAVVIGDLVHRLFKTHGYHVTFVRNYTDVGHLTGDNIGDADTGEDRMAKASIREQLSPDMIANKYIEIFEHDIKLLNIIPPTHSPKATEHIHDMITLVKKLLERGYAYMTDYAVYFDSTKYDDYTKLSGQQLDAQKSGEGHGTVLDKAKKHPADFALWFFKAGTHANALQTWKSPFTSPLVIDGEGFPGWHIECSAMSKHFLGNTFDIHMGGIEHIPIHHTNEIAQSVCANGTDFAHYWLHNEHLMVDGKKMSKSEGTSYTLSDIIERGYDPLVLRYFFLQAHYRSKQNMTWEALSASQTALKKLRALIQQYPDDGSINQEYETLFLETVSDDINTAGGLAIVWELLKNNAVSDADKKATILFFDEVLGLDLGRIETEHHNDPIPEFLYELLEERKIARENQDWQASDRLRDEIKALGYIVTDGADGQEVRRI
jgi:cysteinyl-tRNA synthetase